MLISKRGDNEKMTVLEKDNGKKKTKLCWGGVFSCFGDSTVYELDVANKEFQRKPVRKRAWSRFARKKKTVPIEIAGNAMDCEMKRRNSDREKVNNCKDQSKPAECPDQTKKQKQKQQKSISADKTMSDIAELPVQHIASRSDFLSKSAPLCRALNPVQTQTQLPTSNCNSPELSCHSMPEIFPREKEDPDREPTGKIDSSKILPIITVAIILLLLFGRGFAVFCMCIYFYIVSRFKSETENMDQMKKGSKEIDLNSEMHKKKVVLRGFLERDKKKPASNLGSPSR
ncbi:hypothetical protein FCM35_KLT13448 [Carex littledalei]|uniref:Uncharacterized protein n=1 Tax=Carex littledalei TaxID=544730 RepID=A0A833QP67_9POAL|nr:hypothetical protein FCM35_KLT13448 [Carex littledalei]